MIEPVLHQNTPASVTAPRALRPRVPGGFPLVGHALAFGRDPDEFVAAQCRRYGTAFRIRMPGGERTFLMDPRDYPTVFAEQRLRFQESAAEIGGRVFGYDPAMGMDPRYHELSNLTSRDMRGDPLQVASERMQVAFTRRIARAVGQDELTMPLLGMLTQHFFAAGVDALFGDGFSTKAVYDAYATVDRFFAAAVAGVPVFLLPGFIRARNLLAAKSGVLARNHALVMDSRAEFFDRIGLERGLREKFDASVLWASQANTVAAAFWTLHYILADSRARGAVRDELADVLGPPTSLDAAEPISKDALRRLVVLDSACSEAMRLTSGPMNGRKATEALALPLASGEVLSLAQGEDILLYPRHTHLDPEIFDSPLEFRFDRFVDDRGRPAQFAKNGTRLTMAFLPFGGGATMCPGRFFARNEIKVLVATMLHWLDSEVAPGPKPGLDFSRIGLGILPPTHDVPLRLRPRVS